MTGKKIPHFFPKSDFILPTSTHVRGFCEPNTTWKEGALQRKVPQQKQLSFCCRDSTVFKNEGKLLQEDKH